MRPLLMCLASVLLGGTTSRAQEQRQVRFLPAVDCALCHTRIAEPGKSWSGAGPWVGPYAFWPATMMANANADPYWRARVRVEVEAGGNLGRVVEDTCLRCHAPAGQYPRRPPAPPYSIAEIGSEGAAREGVTCTVCHQILSEGLGRADSFTAGFRIGVEDRIFGPHKAPFAMPMRHHTGLEPTESKHILDSALCGTCHTVVTEPLEGGAGGKPARLVEQGPFLEWLASDNPKAGRTCQGCHMPALTDEAGSAAAQYIAHRPPGGPFPPTAPRLPFGRHEFAGGNATIPLLLASREQDPKTAAALRAAAERARVQLGRALRLDVSPVVEGQYLRVKVDVVNLSGHKLPTGFPSRRLWLRVSLKDRRGNKVFQSGDWDPATGRLRDGEDYQPHHALIDRAGLTQIFEAETVDLANRPTILLIRGAAYRKDNRILPAGFDVGRLRAAGLGDFAISPTGVGDDEGFRPGSARTEYRIRVDGATTGMALEVEAAFQTIKPSHWLPSFRLPAELAQPRVIARFWTKL
jgi:hypothetical protein